MMKFTYLVLTVLCITYNCVSNVHGQIEAGGGCPDDEISVIKGNLPAGEATKLTPPGPKHTAAPHVNR